MLGGHEVGGCWGLHVVLQVRLAGHATVGFLESWEFRGFLLEIEKSGCGIPGEAGKGEREEGNLKGKRSEDVCEKAISRCEWKDGGFEGVQEGGECPGSGNRRKGSVHALIVLLS